MDTSYQLEDLLLVGMRELEFDNMVKLWKLYIKIHYCGIRKLKTKKDLTIRTTITEKVSSLTMLSILLCLLLMLLLEIRELLGWIPRWNQS